MDNPSQTHDLPLGRITHCQVCGSDSMDPVVDLGFHPPCDSLLLEDDLHRPEKSYPLRFLRCTNCSLAQIDYVVEPEVLFFADYPYRTGITATLVNNLQNGAKSFVDRFKIPQGSLAIDLGSNDGTFLLGFKKAGLNVLGVEPTNIAKIAEKNGVPTVQSFFGTSVGKNIAAEHGPAHIVTAANMFAHIPNLGDLINGVDELLNDDGIFVSESHYLLDLIETTQYDSIYHEHLKYYSLKSLVILLESYNFTVIDAERIPNYGGSIRLYAQKGKGRTPEPRLNQLLAAEEEFGLYDRQVFDRFAEDVKKSKLDLMKLLTEINSRGERVVGVGCPGRSSTLLNYCGITPDLMPFIAEQSTSLKLGMYLPGKHIQIRDEKEMFDNQPEYALMLSWHYADPIIKKLREKGLRSKIILPLPKVQVLEA